MKLYDFLYHPKTPDGIESRKAHIVGGGIAGLAATANCNTIYEKHKRCIPAYPKEETKK